MNKDYVLREESFGFTFFDKQKLHHQFLLITELKDFRKKINLNDKNTETLKIKRKK